MALFYTFGVRKNNLKTYRDKDYLFNLKDINTYYHLRYDPTRYSMSFNHLPYIEEGKFIGVHGMLEVMKRLMIYRDDCSEMGENEPTRIYKYIDEALTKLTLKDSLNKTKKNKLVHTMYENVPASNVSLRLCFNLWINATYNAFDYKKVETAYDRMHRENFKPAGPNRDLVVAWIYDAGFPNRRVMFQKAWRTSTTIALAQQMWNTQCFHAMPILADAMQDAGCEHLPLLDYCRNCVPGEVTRANWLISRLLKKERY